MSDTEWLNGLKVGDRVVVHTGGWGLREIAAVTDVAKKSVTVGHYGSFRRRCKYSNGDGVGRHSRRGISPLTEEDRAEIEEEHFRAKAIGQIAHMRRDEMNALTTDQLRRIASILEEGKEKE